MRQPIRKRSILFLLMGLAAAWGCHQKEPSAGTPPEEPTTHAAGTPLTNASHGAVNYAKPDFDLGPDRFAERVDGAEAKLRRLGCLRLRMWRLTAPPADFELLTFSDDEGPAKLLADETGGQLSTETPGDAGWIGRNSLYFRRGRWLARLIADGPESPSSLLAPARELEHALARGEITP